jgi:hypothetical protein
MTDIAELAFRVQTAELDKAAQKLDKIKIAASGVSAASTQTAAVVEGAAVRVSAAKTSMARADAAEATAALKRLQVTKQATQEELAAARALSAKTKLALADAVAEQRRAKALLDAAAAQKASTAAQRVAFGNATSTSLGATQYRGPALAVNNGPQAPGTPNDQMPNRFNTANIAAQFQDIGVTAAMGMNPMIIALQQGTQLAAIMNSMQKPMQGLAIAFKQIFNATSLWTIGIVAAVAALLQFVNWTSVAKTSLNLLADGIQLLLPYLAAIAAGLMLIYSRTIIAGIASLATTMVSLAATALATGAKMAMAWIIGLGPIGWIAAAIVALGVLFQMFGVNVLGYVKTAVNGIVGAFVGAFNAVKATWRMLPGAMGDIVIGTANIVLKKIGDMINGFISMINGLAESLPDWAKPKDGGKITWKADLQIENPFEGQAAAAGKAAGDAFKESMNVDYVGKANEAVQNVADSIAGKIREFASGIGKEKDKKGKKDPWEELVKGAERQIATMKAEAEAVGMSAMAAAKLKYETELLNEAQQKNIKLTPEQKQKIDELAQGMATAEIHVKRVKDAFEFGKDAVQGFFQDMKQGLQEGKSLWESFGNAVTNVLNIIFDKMLDKGTNLLWEGLDKMMGGGSGGSGSAAGSGIGSFLSDIGDFLFSAKGNAFGRGGAMAFAKGGAFSNSVVNSTTPFAFANGGKFGVMGEAGPEAVMPLHRGPDGSLGVRTAGNDNNGGGIAVVNIYNNGNSKVTTEQRQSSRGLEIDVMIDQATAQNLSRQGSESRRALDTVNQRQLISR